MTKNWSKMWHFRAVAYILLFIAFLSTFELLGFHDPHNDVSHLILGSLILAAICRAYDEIMKVIK
jgi:hypothetical protein